MIEIGRLCIKIAGRDAGLKCVVVDDLGKGFVLIDGQTRRRKCNTSHLEPLNEVLNIKKNAAHDEVVRELKKLKIEVAERKEKKKKTEKPLKQRKKKEKITEEGAEKPAKEEKEVKETKPKASKKEPKGSKKPQKKKGK